MKAIVYTDYGSPDVLKLKEVAKPTPKEHEVLIKVHAASINSWDWELLKGKPIINRLINGFLKPKKIKILGCDIAGKVEAVGRNVKQFKPGDEVFGDLSTCGWGGFAEYVCAHENALTLKPDNITPEQAASVPQAGLLALQGLYSKGQLQLGQKVLINGAGGGVGTFAVQIAHSLGAKVTGVDSTKKLGLLRSLGADHVIDYTQEDFTKNGQRYDFILDVTAQHSISSYKHSLKPRGVYVAVGGSSGLINQLLFFGPFISLISGKKMMLLFHKANERMDFMKELIETDKVIPVIDRYYPLDKTAEALEYFGKGDVKGKIVIALNRNS